MTLTAEEIANGITFRVTAFEPQEQTVFPAADRTGARVFVAGHTPGVPTRVFIDFQNGHDFVPPSRLP